MMNRVALRMSLVLLGMVALALIIVQVFIVRQLAQSMQARVPARERVAAETLRRYLMTVAPERRASTARAIGTTVDAPVETLKLADPRISDSARTGLGARGFSFEFGQPVDGILWVLVPETDDVLRFGLDLAPPPPLWKALTLLVALVTMIGIAGTLLARPFVRRISYLREASVRIARGELGARAVVAGNDAVADFARQFNQMAERNQMVVEKQRDLMRAVSHELRTPAARIRFALELLGEAGSKAEVERHISAIDSDLGEIDSLIQELVTLDRLDRPESESTARAESFDVARAVAAALLRLPPSRPDVEVSTVSALPEGSVAAGSERLFRRAVRNLVSNGVRHARGKVRISLVREGSHVLVSIDDDGPGIPAFERARVLELFARLDPSRSRDSGGLGLGLPIVDRILGTVGGQLKIDDSDLGGASVTMSWPAHTDSG